jgi:hypothetical protein
VSGTLLTRNLSLGATLRFRPWWKYNHHGLEMDCTSGDHERGLLSPLYHCWCPRGGGVFLSSHNKIHDTHTTRREILYIRFIKFSNQNCLSSINTNLRHPFFSIISLARSLTHPSRSLTHLSRSTSPPPPVPPPLGLNPSCSYGLITVSCQKNRLVLDYNSAVICHHF